MKANTSLYLNFFDENYIYSPLEASQELDLEPKLIQQLVQEYVAQLLQANVTFSEYIKEFKLLQANNQEIDFTLFKNLAHKNLGVARNLRIKDCEDILQKMMTEEKLDYLGLLVDVLESCAIKLSPDTASKSLQ